MQPEFGTGALKVTPGHDATDYEIGQRHSLPIISVIAPDGTMDTPDLPDFHGMRVEQARLAVTEALRREGAVVAEDEYVHDVGHCDRCGGVLEPLISEQWWVRMKPLAAPAIEVAERGDVRFHPARFTDVYLMSSPTGGPVDSTIVPVLYLFNNAFQYFKMGYASALAWVLFVIILALTVAQLKMAPRWVHYEAEKK